MHPGLIVDTKMKSAGLLWKPADCCYVLTKKCAAINPKKGRPDIRQSFRLGVSKMTGLP